ncbi:LacI family DNA-binding transcriptional regulator [Mesorhizobium sp. M0816]|uniref:LacI family DNA-binding transcriptional regulator n=1 Tax=Mesorhizobium sp. M0816 TaxID=2957006 RepID=UPI00333C06C8
MPAAKNSSGVRPSIHNVAAYAGVSIATVSKVMHGDKTVRPENVKSVQNAIEALGYRINPLAADLRRGRRNLIGIIVPSYDDPYYASLIGALEREAERRGYALAATSSRNSEKRELELVGRMEDWRVSGVILVPVKNENGPSARALNESEMAAVFIDNVTGGNGTETIAFDYHAAIRDIVAQTARLSHKRILVSVQDQKSQSQMRLASYLVEQLKAAVPGADIQVLPSPSRREKLAEALAEIFGSAERPTLVLSFCELAITLCLNVARRLEWHVPDDLSLFSFKPAAWMRAMEPAIGVVQLPIDNAAVTIMDTIFQKIENNATASRDRLLPCKVDFGQSMTTPRERIRRKFG